MGKAKIEALLRSRVREKLLTTYRTINEGLYADCHGQLVVSLRKLYELDRPTFDSKVKKIYSKLKQLDEQIRIPGVLLDTKIIKEVTKRKSFKKTTLHNDNNRWLVIPARYSLAQHNLRVMMHVLLQRFLYFVKEPELPNSGILLKEEKAIIKQAIHCINEFSFRRQGYSDRVLVSYWQLLRRSQRY